MGDLPAGHVTFAFTDVEGSTRLQAKLGSEAAPLLDMQASLIVDAVRGDGGHLVDRIGDGLLIAFPDSSGAIAACVSAQLAILRHPWPADAGVLVRMGIHSGPADPVGGNYTALAVNQAARVVDAAHGGQIVVSEETARAVDALPHPLSLAPLGYYRVRDFEEPIALFEVRHPNLPPTSLAVRAPRLLDEVVPARRTSFIGREAERSALDRAIAKNRLVTLAGPGGVGKTRLAVELASAAPAAWIVDLASAQDETAVPATIAASLGVRVPAGSDPLGAVIERIGKTEALVVLDNCEHVLDTLAGVIDRLLGGAQRMRILATSQAPLGASGERLIWLNPMELPPEDPDAPLDSVLESESARLFIDRARAADADFGCDPGDAADLARLCRALDGLPLALELAATRVRTLGLKELADRIDERFSLLGGGTGGTTRHATLRGAIEWSYSLLEEGPRRLLRRLSVFRGSFTIADAQAVSGEGVLEEIVTLVDRSLVQRETGTSTGRFRLLESIRAFAAEELRTCGEEPETRNRHLNWCSDMARSSAISAQYVGDVDASLAWAPEDPSRVTAGAGLAELIVPHPGAVPLDLLAARLEPLLHAELDAATRVRVLRVAAEVALRVGSPDRQRLAIELLEESRRADVEIGSALLVAGSVAASYGRFSEALTLLDEAAARALHEGDERAQLRITLRSASVRLELGQLDVVEPLQAVVAAMRDVNDPLLPVALNNLAIAHERTGAFPASLAAHDEALALRRAAGDTMGEVTTLVNSASVLVRMARFEEARARLLEVLDHPTVGHNLLRVASICGTAGELLAAEGRRPLEAARLMGAHRKIREHHGRPDDAEDDAQSRPYITRLVEAVGEEAYARAFQEGYALDPQTALPRISAALSDG